MSEFFDETQMAAPSPDSLPDQSDSNRRRRRTKMIALVALGSVGALGVYSCANVQNENDEWNGADGGQVAENGQPGNNQGTVRSRGPSIWPWMWLMSRNSGVRTSNGVRPGSTSGFVGSSSGSRTTGSTGARTSGTSSSSGGFGSFGRAFSGLS